MHRISSRFVLNNEQSNDASLSAKDWKNKLVIKSLLTEESSITNNTVNAYNQILGTRTKQQVLAPQNFSEHAIFRFVASPGEKSHV